MSKYERLKKIEKMLTSVENVGSVFKLLESELNIFDSKSTHNPTTILNCLINSGSQDLFHQYVMRYMGHYALEFDIARRFYSKNAYPEECRELYKLTERESIEFKQFAADPRQAAKIKCFLQKCDSDQARYQGLMLHQELKNRLISSIINDKKAINIGGYVKAGIMPWLDKGFLFLKDQIISRSNFAFSDWPCAHGDDIIIKLCETAYFNEFEASSNLVPLDFSSKKENLLLFLPGTLYHPRSRWNNSHIQIYKAFRYLTSILKDDFNLFPVRSMLDGSFAKNIYQQDFQSSLSYHTGMRRDIIASKDKDHKMRTLHYKEAYIPGTFTLNSEGYSGWANIENTKISYKYNKNLSQRVYDNFFKTTKDSKTSKYKQTSNNKNNNLNLLKPFIFLPLQVVSDTVARLAKISSYELLEHLPTLAQKHEINFVIKRHPLCENSDLEAKLAEISQYPEISVVNDHIHDIISNSIGVLTVNSGVGFEALTLGKSVITTGISDYKKLTLFASNLTDLNSHISKLKTANTDPNLITKSAQEHCLSTCFIPEVTDEENLREFFEDFYIASR